MRGVLDLVIITRRKRDRQQYMKSRAARPARPLATSSQRSQLLDLVVSS